MKKILGFALAILLPVYLFGQEKISQMVQENKIVKSKENSLFYIDFSATWCGPCVHVAKYLNVLQKQNPTKFYIVSMFNEPVQKVQAFINRDNSALAFAIDFEGNTFGKYKVSALPYGVLLNAKGKLVWQGKASDLTDAKVKRFLKFNKSVSSIDSVFRKHANLPVFSKEYTPKDSLELVLDEHGIDNLNVLVKPHYKKIKADLKRILAYYYNLHEKQIELSDSINKAYTLYVKKGIDDKRVIAYLLAKLHLKKEESTKVGQVLEVRMTSSANFWDCSQINWEEGDERVLMSDSDIKADNMSLNKLYYYLAFAVNKPIVVKSLVDQASLHDWEIHYKYFELMKQQLSDNYSIDIVEKKSAYPVYRFE